jgi:hypothetical protein
MDYRRVGPAAKSQVHAVGDWCVGRLVCRVLLVALFCGATVFMPSARAAQSGDADTPVGYFRGDQWSVDARSLRAVYVQWLTRRVAAERLARFPDSANTVGWLAAADRVNDALDVLERIIARRPTSIADALESMIDQISHLHSDASHTYEARVHRLIAAAQRTFPTLDRESAARLDIVLLSFGRGLSSTREAQ